MGGFFQALDVFLCPSLRESFGLTCVEAQLCGCPVIAAAVDGMPEAVQDGVTGFCLPATQSLAAYRALCSSADGIPEQVYDPVADRLMAPHVVDPAAIAEKICWWAAHPEEYRRMSAAGPARAREFDLDRFVGELNSALLGYLR